MDGLRVDHPDGLYDPAQYFDRLKQGVVEAAHKFESIENSKATEDASRYVVIEKILTGSERLPNEWPVCGTTGYDFSNLVNGLYVDPAAALRFERIYRSFTGVEASYDDLAYRCRKLIIRVALASELNVLANQFTRIALSKRSTCDFTLNSLRDALMEVVANFPVYRTYVTAAGSSEKDTGLYSPRNRVGEMEKSGRRYQHFRFRQGGASDQHCRGTRSCLSKRRHRLRHEIPAVHQSGDGQRSGGHRFLPLQPTRLIE